jgi:hypothetical protein
MMSNIPVAPDLGGIDLSRPMEYPVFFVLKPDGTTVAKIKHAMNISYKQKLGDTNEIQFDVPYQIFRNGQSIRNPIIDLIKERYLLKLVFNNREEMFIIEDITEKAADSSTNSGDMKTITAYSRNYELTTKIIPVFDAEGINLTTAMIGGQVTNSKGDIVEWEGILSNTGWGLGYVDAKFDETYLTFNDKLNNALEETFKVAKAFGAVVVWDTMNRLVNFYDFENIGMDKGFRLSYNNALNSQKYLNQYSRDIKTDQLVTRLHVYGKDDISINSVNPTGADYIEDYSYFMQGFAMDGNGNVISHSPYMSDSLCIALTNYQKKVQSLSTEFKSLLATLESQQEQLTLDQNKLADLETNLMSAQQIIDSYNASTDWKIATLTFNNSSSQNVTLNENYYYVVFVNSDGTAIISFNDVNYNIEPNTWQVAGKINAINPDIPNSYTLSVNVQMNDATTVNVVIAMIFQNEYVATTNNTDLLVKYCVGYNQDLVNQQNDIIMNDNNLIESTVDQIYQLQQQLDVKNNFTEEQLEEWNYYIIEGTFTDSNISDPQVLYDQAVKVFAAMTSPQVIYQISLANFLEDVKAQREWDKINLGDVVTINMPYFNQQNIKGKIVEIDWNFESGDITLSIANVADIRTGEYKFVDMLYQNIGTSTQFTMDSYKWNSAYDQANKIAGIINSTWDATKREITAGVNESVTINNRGITITDPTHPERMLIAQAGVLAVSGDGGNTWKHAIRYNGIVGESVYGVLLAGENLTIESDRGLFTIDENGITVSGQALRIVGGLPISEIDQDAVGLWNQALQPNVAYNGVTIDSVNGLVVTADTKMQRTIVNATLGFAIQKNIGSPSSPVWENVFSVDPNGNLTADGLIAKNIKIITNDPNNPQTLIDGQSKLLNFSGFTIIQGTINGSTNIADGTITNQKIVSISADKITTGTLDASRVNVINLNANNITTGVLDASRIGVINLDATNITTGTLNGITINGSQIYSDDGMGNYIELLNGQLYSQSWDNTGAVYNVTMRGPRMTFTVSYTDGSNKTYSSYTEFLPNINGDFQLMNTTGNIWIQAYNDINFQSRLNMNNHDIVGVNSLHINDPGGGEGIVFDGGNGWIICESPDDGSNAPGQIQFYQAGIRKATLSTNGNFFVTGTKFHIQNPDYCYYTSDGTTVVKSDFPNSASLYIGTDGSPRIWSMDIYYRTTTSAANVNITSSGTLCRSTSSRKYKLLEEPIPDDLPYKILNLVPKTWYDKTAVERYAEALANGEDVSQIDIPPIERIPGLIAEDVVDAGLGQYVIYGHPDENGNREVEGLMYDRLWTLLIPLVRELYERVQELENKIKVLGG